MTCKVNADTTNGLKLTSDTSGAIDLQSNGTTRVSMDASGNVTATSFIGDGSSLTGVAGLPDAIDVNASAPADSLNIDASGNVGVGTSSPDQNLHVSDTSSNAYVKIISNDSNTAGILFGDQNSGLQGKLYYLNGSDAMRFDTNGSERMRIDSSGNLKFDSGYGSAVTAYGVRAWVNFNGTGTVAISDSGNVSSITDFTTGVYGVNLTTAMPDTNYSFVALPQKNSTVNSDITVSERHNYTRTTSQFRIDVRVASINSPHDPARCNVILVR
jgi:hypothetical protein